MKLKTRVIASILLSLAAFSAHAAQELTPEQAAAVKPFDRISFNGRFDAIFDAVAEASKRADKAGADAFYIQAINEQNRGNSQTVYVDLYHKEAPKADATPAQRTFDGIRELPQHDAYHLEPFDTVSVSGYFSTQPDINAAIAKAAKEKNAASFFIVRQVDINSTGTNQKITAYVYQADAPKRVVQSTDVIPADSDAGRAALAAGGEAAAKVEISGVAMSGSPSRNVGNFYETQASKGGRYTVNLADGKSIQELNKATAAQMTPFDSITFRGNFNGTTDVSEAVAKRAADKGAKYYHITKQWFNKRSNMTISADLYK
ncbi:DUF1471 family protein YdgH [Symbiopectobacterium purcellii]|uniref:DUF1471 family protein YdgH n=1 Tax=Symbiopectobacterium purcellii TaxID=2871826 RepID=UPI003F83F771